MRRGRRKPLSEEEREAAYRFWAATVSKPCALCGNNAWPNGSERHRHAHHVIPQQTLKRHGHHDRLWDPANGLALCAYPCHANHTSGSKRVPRSVLPAEAEAFAAELGLTHILDRQYA